MTFMEQSGFRAYLQCTVACLGIKKISNGKNLLNFFFGTLSSLYAFSAGKYEAVSKVVAHNCVSAFSLTKKPFLA